MLLVLSGCLVAGMLALASASAFLLACSPARDHARLAETAAAPSLPTASSEVTRDRAVGRLCERRGQRPICSSRTESVVVDGIVRSIERDYEGSMVARLATGDAFETVDAKLATRNDPTIVGVIKGRTVSVLCVGRGALLGSPQLGGCFVR